MATAKISAANAGDNSLVPGQAGQIIKVWNYVIIPASSVVVKFTSGPGGVSAPANDMTGPMTLSTQGLWPGFSPVTETGLKEPHFKTPNAGDDLVLNLASGVQVSGYLNYTYERL